MFHFTPPLKSYRGYIFDCDGTLADSMPLHLRAWNHGLRTANAPFQLDGKNFMSVAGMSTLQTVHHWNATHDLKIDPELAINEKNRYFVEHHHEVKPLQAVVDFARQMAAEGKAISVASGGTYADVSKTLQIIGAADLFDVVITADDVKRAKPAPDLFLLAAERMGIPCADCLVIEDSPLGVQAAHTAGMEAILIPATV